MTTPEIREESAKVNLSIRLRNRNNTPANVSVETVILDAENKKSADKKIASFIIRDSLAEIKQVFTLNDPVLWSVEKPYLYRVVTKIYTENEICDSYEKNDSGSG